MGKQPAVVIIVRHGARLDQADRNWSATADAPYDPPLSYGGWIQCQSLGVRINNELHNLDRQYAATENKDDPSQDGQPRKRRRVIIHSSPYLRCVQTAISIAAGIQHPHHHTRHRMRSRQRSSRTNLSPSEEAPPDVIPDLGESESTSLQRTTSREQQHTNRIGYNTSHLRIDAFLGEWLSSTYFDSASAPPPSAVLVSQAKLTLQNPPEEIKGADLSTSMHFNLSTLDWEEKENEATNGPVPEKTGLKAMAAVGHSLPKRQRNISFGTELANGARILNRVLQRSSGYNPPVPNYAIGSSDKIPPGFVAHARDACVEIDHDWDSQHTALDWGDGGPYDEDWGKMHRRFRNGLHKMMAHYEGQRVVEDPKAPGSDDDDDDLVLVLVTHQAGCNALIRLLTGAPALHDVGLASLSMAVRKGEDQTPSESRSPTRRRGSLDLAVSDDYDVKIIASTEHLRAGSNPLGLNSPRLGKSPAFASRRAVGADSPEGFSLGESWASQGSSSTRVPGRSASQRPHAGSVGEQNEPQTGLWRRGSRYSRDETAESSDAVMTPSLQSVGTTDSIPEELWGDSGDVVGDINPDPHHLPVRSASQRGLWGGESIKRERSPGKRRWTAVDRSP